MKEYEAGCAEKERIPPSVDYVQKTGRRILKKDINAERNVI